MKIFNFKYILLFAASLTGMSVNAQSIPFSSPYDFIEAHDIKFSMMQAHIGDNLVDWTGKGLHIGKVKVDYILTKVGEVPENYLAPESPEFYFQVSDMYGNPVSENIVDLKNFFNKNKLEFMTNYNSGSALGIDRGGTYKAELSIEPNLLATQYELIIADEPCTRVVNTETRIGNPLSMTVKVSSGYPYNPSDISGTEMLNWTLYSVGDNEELTEMKNGTHPIDLTNDTPLLAAVDVFDITVDDLPIGKYQFVFTSDFAGANRTVDAMVTDIAHAELSLDKEQYSLDTDKEATLHVEMSYGFPYIMPTFENPTSTVTVITCLLDEDEEHPFSNAQWETADMQLSEEITINLEGITKEISEEYDGELPLTVKIKFNRDEQYVETIPLKLSGYSAIQTTVMDNISPKIQYYNLLGNPVNADYKGILITSDGKKIIQK